MPIETRSNNALFKRAEQLKRWEDSETNKVSSEIPTSKKSKIKFSDGCVFLAACAAGDTAEVEFLLQQSADINTANVDGLTALHQACIDDNLDMVQFLVEHGCDVNQGDNEGWTPLHATASCGFVSIAKYLIENKADIAAVNNDGDLPIDIAESPKIEELLSDALDEKGIDCDEARSGEERIMLEDANQWLNSNTYVDQIHTRTGASALHVAAAKGYISVMHVLIKAGADLNAQDNDGWTPLHAAAHWAQKEASAVLADNLANMDIQNFSGQTCFDVAEPELVKLLEELKKKQASMQKERPEIQSILQRTSTRPPLKRRTSVTRMSGQEKSKSVMKDTKSERAQIEQLSLPEEDDEEKKQQEVRDLAFKREMKRIMDESFLHKKPEPVPEVEVQLSGKIPSWKKALRRSSESLDEDTKVTEEPEVILKKPKNVEPEEKTEITESSNGPASGIGSKESGTVKKVWSTDSSNHSTSETPEDMNTSLPSSPSDASSDSLSQGKRPFIPPARDEESELQRKAHAKRVRETRRSTQGVLLEDVKTAELQYIIKTTQKARESQTEDDNEEKDNDETSDKKDADESVDTDKTGFSTEDALEEKESSDKEKTKNLTDKNQEQKEGVSERVRSRYGSSAYPQVSSEASSRSETPSRYSSLSCSKNSLNDESENDYKKLYEELKEENERLKDIEKENEQLRESLKTAEEELERTKKQLKKMSESNNSRNSVSEAEKKERRALERKISEMEEECKTVSKLKTENEKLKAENRALSRVVCKLSK